MRLIIFVACLILNVILAKEFSNKFNVEAKIVYNYNINFDNRLTTQNNIVIPVTIKQESNYIVYYY